MTPVELLRKEIALDVFDYNQLMFVLADYKKPRDVVTKLLKNGKILRIRKGFYCFGPVWCRQVLSTEVLANLIFGPSAISLDYALYHYGLIPEQVKTITSVTPGRKRFYETPVGKFLYIHLPTQFFSFGLSMENTKSDKYLIMQPIKALADKVWTDSRFNPRSLKVFSDYLFQDLRIDEKILLTFLNEDILTEIEHNFTTKKIKLLVEFLDRLKK